VRRVLAALVVVTGVVGSVTSSSAMAAPHGKPPVPGIGIRLIDVPTATIDDPRTHVYIIDRLAPGRVIERRVQVVNDTRSDARVSMYAAAAHIRHGEFIPAIGHTRNDLVTWISTAPHSLDLAPQQRAYVHVTVRPPPNTSPGERYGVVWAQTTTLPATPGGIRSISRVGIRLYLSIGRGDAPASDFHIVSLTADRNPDNTPTVQASIRNTGGRALDLGGTLTLSKGPSGLSAGPFPVTLGTTLGIGQTAPVSVSLGRQVPDGPWLATLTVQSGLTKRTAHATLTFPSRPGAGIPVAAQSSGGTAWWQIPAGLAIVTILLLLGWYLARRHRQSHHRDSDPDHAARTPTI
jgi:hypothetical protein